MNLGSMKDGEKNPRDSLMLRSSSLLNETTGLWPEKHKNTQNTETKRERSSEAAIVGARFVIMIIIEKNSLPNILLPVLVFLNKQSQRKYNKCMAETHFKCVVYSPKEN
ncbi:hypothetical protein AMECASPLE_021203 [Ameca splendens]|uniref:Uncharacterized protein n=1 Tax=Ameca splendens TaxID=208324 RepID=A0ABV1A9S7_9TELE